jgi:hypothetical protein
MRTPSRSSFAKSQIPVIVPVRRRSPRAERALRVQRRFEPRALDVKVEVDERTGRSVGPRRRPSDDLVPGAHAFEDIGYPPESSGCVTLIHRLFSSASPSSSPGRLRPGFRRRRDCIPTMLYRPHPRVLNDPRPPRFVQAHGPLGGGGSGGDWTRAEPPSSGASRAYRRPRHHRRFGGLPGQTPRPTLPAAPRGPLPPSPQAPRPTTSARERERGRPNSLRERRVGIFGRRRNAMGCGLTGLTSCSDGWPPLMFRVDSADQG